jgi:hypothetical protein
VTSSDEHYKRAAKHLWDAERERIPAAQQAKASLAIAHGVLALVRAQSSNAATVDLNPFLDN